MRRITFTIIFVIILLLNANILHADDASVILKGDADCNGVVNGEDALLVLEILADLKDMDNTFSIRQCDLTGDYEVGVDDALNMLKVAAKIIEQETLDDPKGIYSSIEYENGYPKGYGVDSNGDALLPRLSYRLWSSDYYGEPNAFKFESNAAYWKLRWLIEDNIGTDNMEMVYTNHVNVPNLPLFLSNTPIFFTRSNEPPLGRKTYLMYQDGIPYIYLQYLDDTPGCYGTYKYTGYIPYELSEEYLKKTYTEWRKEQYESMNQTENKELKFDLFISDKGLTISNASDSANTARLLIKIKLNPLMATIETKSFEHRKGTYRFDVQDDDIYIIDLRYDGYNISSDFDLSYSFNVLNDSFTGPEVIEVKAYDLNGLEVPVSYTLKHPENN